MARLHVEAEGRTKAAPAVIWRLLEDPAAYCRWGPWAASGPVETDGEPRGAAGALRYMRYGRTTVVERLLEVEPGRRMTYEVVRGLPVRGYRATVTLTPAACGTEVRWWADWDRTLGGWIVQRKLRTLYPEIVGRLLGAAEEAASNGGPVHGPDARGR